jgi:23S rRNA pseudouridine2605 synthase
VKTNNPSKRRTGKTVSAPKSTRTTRKTEKSPYNDNFRKREKNDSDSFMNDEKKKTRFSANKSDSFKPTREPKSDFSGKTRRTSNKPFSRNSHTTNPRNPRKPYHDDEQNDSGSLGHDEKKKTRFSTNKSDSFKPTREPKSVFSRKTHRTSSDKPFSRDSHATGIPQKPYHNVDNPDDDKRNARTNKVGFAKPVKKDSSYDPNAKYSLKKQIEYKKRMLKETDDIRLNRFLANAGICSRREADEYIKAGVVTVNGQVVTELGTKVTMKDKVMFHNQPVKSEKKVYILINKPKDCVTTSEDPQERYTVMDLIKGACNERVYPVGRLDRNTTGVLLLTNDGDMAARLTHPKYNKKKIYHVFLDKPLTKADMETIADGIVLEDGEIHADKISYVEEGDKKQVGLEIHSGRNRIVRRIFEHLGYKVEKLDRVYFAGLTKKNLPRGKYRFLTEKEINMLTMGAYE